MIILGLDPGLTGAIAKYDGENLEVYDVPVFEMESKKPRKLGQKKKGVKRDVDCQALYRLLDHYGREANHAFIEAVHAMPGQGVSSMFTFGKTFGMMIMSVAAIQTPYTLVSPLSWKAKMGLNSDAEVSRQKAIQLFPKHAHFFSRKSDHNRAEAALLALYGLRELSVI